MALKQDFWLEPRWPSFCLLSVQPLAGVGEEPLYPSLGGREQLRTGVRPYFLDNPAVSLDPHTTLSSSATSTPTQQLREPPSLTQLVPLSPSLREVKFNLCFHVRPPTPPQGRQTHRSRNHGIS